MGIFSQISMASSTSVPSALVKDEVTIHDVDMIEDCRRLR